MANLRWLKRGDEMVLQSQVVLGNGEPCAWCDVPVVSEPRKARQWWIRKDGSSLPIGSIAHVAYESDWIKVREVLLEDGE